MQATGAGARKWRGRLLAVGILLALLLALPLAAPPLVRSLAPLLGATWGLSGLSVEIDRPGWRGVTVRRVAFVVGRLAVEARGGRIEYRPQELAGGRARSIVFEALTLTVNGSPPGAPAADGGIPLPLDQAAHWREALPVERAEVHELVLAVPAVDFEGRGRLLLEPDRLALALTGRSPEAAAGFRLDLRAERSGNAALRISERTLPTTGRGAARVPLIAIELTPGPNALDVEGDLRLEGFAWDLAAGLLDLPAGAGSLVGRLQARIPRTEWGAADPAALTGEAKIRSLHWSAAGGAPAVALDTGRLRLAGRSLSGELSGIVRWDERAVPLATSFMVADLGAEPLTVTGVLRGGALAGLAWAAGYDAATAVPYLELDGEIRVAAPFMKSLLERWRESWDLDAGRIVLAADLRWPETTPASAQSSVSEGAPGSALALPSGDVTLDIRDASAHYDDYAVGGLAGRLALELDGAGWRLAPTTLRAATVAAGLEIGDLVLGLAGSPEALAVGPVSAQVFGGTLAVEPFSYVPAEGSASWVVQLTGIDLAKLLALYGERIAGTGVLDGTLPVTLAGTAIAVRDGVVTARPPGGVIRLAPELTRATGQPGLDFALAALADFTYTRLSADVDYAPSGDLQLAVALQGRNPQVEGGRPIHYNLSVSDNVPQLLESLSLHERLVRDIERRVTE